MRVVINIQPVLPKSHHMPLRPVINDMALQNYEWLDCAVFYVPANTV